MLHTADSLVASDYPDIFELGLPKPGPKPRSTPARSTPESDPQESVRVTSGEANGGSVVGRYGEGRTLNVPAVAVTVLLHVVALVAVLQVRHEAVPEERTRLMVVDLKTPPPAAPPVKVKSPPPPATPAVVAPTPRIQVSPVAPTIATTPDPTPLPLPAAASSAPTGPPAPSAAPGTVQSADLGTRMLSATPPRYPTESRRRREQGTVVLALTLGVDGRVANISVAHSSGHSRLDDAALRAVRKWRWAPTLNGGQPVMVRGQVEIPFVLQG